MASCCHRQVLLRQQQQQRLVTPAVQQYLQHGHCLKLQWHPVIQQ
jgi:hypothetical protein